MLEFSKLSVGATVDTAVANFGGAMEADTISKHGRSSKSQMSRRNLMNKIFAIAFVMSVMFPMTACSSNSAPSISTNNNLIGVWEGEDNFRCGKHFYVFFDNGNYFLNCGGSSGGGTYSIYGNILMISSGNSHSLYNFTISGDTLTLIPYGATSEERKVTYKKVKK